VLHSTVLWLVKAGHEEHLWLVEAGDEENLATKVSRQPWKPTINSESGDAILSVNFTYL
jgi:hypothetical protein